MLAKDIISEVVPHIRTSDTGIQALNWMEIFRISHLPIVNNKEFLGLISDTDIYDLNKAEEPIGNHKLSLFSPFVYTNQHLYEVIALVAQHKLTIIPVLNEKKEYLGLITLHDLLLGLSKVTAVDKRGAILVLEMNIHDYSLAQIAQIVESENLKILSSYVSDSESTTKIDVTLKLNSTEISRVIQAFNRYNYIIKASFLEDNELEGMYQNRFDEFMRYLNI
jgi:acetoin utilization protein AcuB